MTVIKQQQDSRLNKNDKSNRNSTVTSFSSTTVMTTSKVLGKENDPEITDITEEFNNSDQIHNKSAKKKMSNTFESIRKIFSQDSRRSSKETNGYEKIEGSPQSTPRSSLVRGDSIKALLHRFQQATVSSSFKQNKSAKSESPNTVRQTEIKTVINKLNSSKTNGSSCLHNNSRATGIPDVQRNVDLFVETGDTSEDIEARALSNKFLGASVIFHGMKQRGESPISNQTATKSSASLVNQVEKHRAQKSPVTRNNPNKKELDNIWVEKQLKILLESCPNYDQRKQIRARLRQIMAEHKEQGNWSNQFGCIKARFEWGTPLTTEVPPNRKNVTKQYGNNILCKCPSENSIPCRSESRQKIPSFKPENGFSHVVKSGFEPVEMAHKPTAPGPLPLQSGVREFWHQMVMGQRQAAGGSTAAGASAAVGKLQRPIVGSVTPYEGYLNKDEIAHKQNIKTAKQQRAAPRLFKLNEDINKMDETFEILFKETFKS